MRAGRSNIPNPDQFSVLQRFEFHVPGLALGRSKKSFKADKKVRYKDSTNRIAIVRIFVLAKHSYGLGSVLLFFYIIFDIDFFNIQAS